MTPPDPLTRQTRALLSCILGQTGFPGVEELRAQAEGVTVDGGRVTMLTLRVPSGSTPSVFTAGPVPVRTLVADATSDAPMGELLLWVDNGYASALEFAWWSDEPPTELPSCDRLRVVRP